MPKVAPKTNQQSLDCLRRIRRKLYAIPESELSSMSLDDQVAYSKSLTETTTAILKLETAKLRTVNQKFKDHEKELNAAATKLESDLNGLEYTTDVVRMASSALDLVTKIVNFV